MFGSKKVNDKLETLTEVISTQNHQINMLSSTVLELKKLVIQLKLDTLANRVAIKEEKHPVRVIEKEITVTRARKKPRARLRTTGGKKITEGEKVEFVKLYDQGLSFIEISGQTGRSASAISKYIYDVKGAD